MTNIVASGRYLGSRPADQDRYVQSIARLESGGVIAAWDNQAGTDGIFVQILNDQGVEVGGPIQLTQSGGQPSVAGLAGGGFAMSWRDSGNGAVLSQVFDADGVPQGAITQATSLLITETQTIAALDGYVVCWSTESAIFVRSFDANGVPVGNAVNVSNRQGDFALADLDDGRVLVAYGNQEAGQPFKISVKIFNPVNSGLSADTLVSFALAAEESLGSVEVTQLASGKILVAWRTQAGDAYKLQGALFTLDGTATGETFEVETGIAYQGTPVAALDGGGFVITYKTTGGIGSPVVAQIFGDDSEAVGSAFTVSTAGEDMPRGPSVTAFGTNDFAIGWSYGLGSGADSSVRSFFSIGEGETIPGAQLIDKSEFRVLTANGQALSVAGSGTVFGTQGLQDITVLAGTTGITFDPSFNRGGDIVRLPGAASDYFVFVSGSNALFFNGETSVSIPVGTAGTAVVFADGARNLVYDAGASAVKIGGQIVTTALSTVTAEPDVESLPTGVDPDAAGRVFLAVNGEATVAGTISVFGSNSADRLVFAGGKAVLDGSFNRGGDMVTLTDDAQEITAYRSGSSVVLTTPKGSVTIPVGTAGMVLDFAGDERILRFDTASAGIKIGGQSITATTAETADHLTMASFAAGAEMLESNFTAFG